MLDAIEFYLRKVLSYIVALLGGLLVFLIGTGVFFRYVVGQALSWPEEIAGIIFVWFTLLGVVLLTQSGEHIEFSYFIKRLNRRCTKILSAFTQISIALFSLLMIFYGYRYALMFLSERTPAAGVPVLWLNLSLPISGVLILFYSQLNIYKLVRSPERSSIQP